VYLHLCNLFLKLSNRRPMTVVCSIVVVVVVVLVVLVTVVDVVVAVTVHS